MRESDPAMKTILMLLLLTLVGCTATPSMKVAPMQGATTMIDCGSPNANAAAPGGFFDGVDSENPHDSLPPVCRTQRYGMSGFWMPLANGRYEVGLTFCESYDQINGPGQRVFDVSVEGVPIRGIDPYAQAGGLYKPLVRRVEVTVRDGKLDIRFIAQKQSPQVNAIQITHLPDAYPTTVPAGFDQPREVPHGKVTAITYPSRTAGHERPANLYTPPGFDPAKSYPLLILLHGGPGAPNAWNEWQDLGRCGTILDNLIADGLAEPMLVVMPLGKFHPPVSPPADPQSADPRARHELFERDLISDLLPYMESHYRLRAGADARALAGLSMGGGQVGWIGPRNADRFAYLGMFSAGLLGTAGEVVRENLPEGSTFNDKIRLFWVAVGDRDRYYPGVWGLAEALDAKGIHYQWHLHHGSHYWEVWRQDLYLFAQRLFK